MILSPVHKSQTLSSSIAVRRLSPTIEVGRDARTFCPRHGARLRFGVCPFCPPPAASTFEAAA
ncbi:MAG: hypothetical protein JWO85_245 [Candidatus Eremiobacteraeota bacterium]|nr:hypothetical protein [Candidatus Eremiobacteraeota bacterium]